MKISNQDGPIEAGTFVESDEILLSEMRATYLQSADNNDQGEYQELKIWTEDGGSGFYLVLSTERWAMDMSQNIDKIVADFKKRLGELKEENEKSF